MDVEDEARRSRREPLRPLDPAHADHVPVERPVGRGDLPVVDEQPPHFRRRHAQGLDHMAERRAAVVAGAELIDPVARGQEDTPKDRAITQAIDQLREKFGRDAIARGRTPDS